jgi:DNA polymerase-1
METEGINLVPFFKSMSSEMQKEIDTSNKKIYETAGEIQPSIPKQLGDILLIS